MTKDVNAWLDDPEKPGSWHNPPKLLDKMETAMRPPVIAPGDGLVPEKNYSYFIMQDGLDFHYPHDDEFAALDAFLSDDERVDAVIAQMQYIFENTPTDDRYYDLRKMGYERLSAYRDGKYTLFLCQSHRTKSTRCCFASAAMITPGLQHSLRRLPVPARRCGSSASFMETLLKLFRVWMALTVILAF